VINQEHLLINGQPLKIALVHPIFAQNMGYANTIIPRILAQYGAEVHYITTNMHLYPELRNQKETYGDFIKPLGNVGEILKVDGYDVHIMDHRYGFGGVRYRGLREKILSINPDIVQTFNHTSIYSLELALLRMSTNFAYFTGNHTTASVYPLAQRKTRWWEPAGIREFILRGIPGRITSSQIELCHGATEDCSDVAVRFFGVPHSKITTIPLGVDTDVFHPSRTPSETDAAYQLRRSLGVDDSDLMCVYTGRFSDEKNPLLLARAVASLRQAGHPFRSVFFGDGTQRDAIAACDGATVHAFIPYTELGTLYRAADIGVWPTQESTSMIDAAACGLPTIVNDTIVAIERIEGNGVTYRLNDQADLERALLELQSPQRRAELGAHGARKMKDDYSWESLVARRLADYRAALGKVRR
jgi:glycosyltransferase involved in cell wall biosynthesis